jgi:hypothetical protein
LKCFAQRERQQYSDATGYNARAMKKAILLLTLLLAGVRIAAQTNIDYSAPPNAPFTAEEVTIPAKGYTLAGTLLMPKHRKGKVPVVLTITGSGQQTRDSPMPFTGLEKYGMMRQIAEALGDWLVKTLKVKQR